MAEKTPVYNGYEERHVTGEELYSIFTNSFLATGRHHSEVIGLPIFDYLKMKQISNSKCYRIFINQYFCRIMNADTDKLITFFGHSTLEKESLHHKLQYNPIEKTCPNCGSPMNIKEGKFGFFLGCSRYPHCKGIKKIPIIATSE